MPSNSILSTSPYKGTRDFYPDDSLAKTENIQIQHYIFDVWRKTLLSLGYEEYDSSILENAEIYIQKSGEELGGNQLYNFHDKSQRHLALRPEMTPTLARMVADKHRELKFPLRWFSVPNCFRYERPQKGRLREFWQLNVDLVGLEAGSSDLEILFVITQIFKAFGATPEMFEIKISDRQILDNFLKQNHLETKSKEIYGLLDNWHKITNQQEIALQKGLSLEEFKKIEVYLKQKFDLGIDFELFGKNIIFDPTIVRGLAYYTGLVLECFDKHPDFNRAIFGGGRYDNLLDIFDKPRTPAIGFGMGDAPLIEFLRNWKLLEGNLNYENWLKNYKKPKVGIMPILDFTTEQSQDLEEIKKINSANSIKEKQLFNKIYTQIIPNIQKQNQTWDIDYSFERSEKKRYETLKKRGCQEILKVEID